MSTVELYDPAGDPEPDGWAAFHTAAELPATWDYSVLRHASEHSWAPAMLGVFRTDDQITGMIGGLYRGLRASGTPRRRRRPLVLDVRLPAEGHEATWRLSGRPDEQLRAFERAAKKWFGPGLTAIVYRQIGRDDRALVTRRGAIIRPIVPNAEMPIQWDSADGWLQSLDAKRRHDIRSRALVFDDDRDLTISISPARTDLDPAELARLSNRRMAGRLDPLPPLPPEYFAALLAREDVSTLSYVAGDGRLLAFGMFLHHSTRPRLSWWAALPAEEGGRADIYVDSYLRYVEYAIKQGARRLSAGRGVLEEKTRLGFRPVPMSMAVVPRWSLG